MTGKNGQFVGNVAIENYEENDIFSLLWNARAILVKVPTLYLS
jgi:hypothetical protein